MPFTNMGADASSSRANDPHPAGVAGFGPLTFVDDNHVTTRTRDRVEIIFVDPEPFNVDCTSTLATSVT